MSKFYTAQEIADQLKIKKTTVYELIKRGELQSSKIGKQIRISKEQLTQYVHQASLDFPEDDNTQYHPESSILKREYIRHLSGLIVSGQNSPVLELLCGLLEKHPEHLPVLLSHMNSYNGLYALYFEKTHLASCSLDDEQICGLCPGVPLTVLHLYSYTCGFFVKEDNPKNIQTISDLARTDVILANREKGSSIRIRLDHLLKASGIDTHDVAGYGRELVSNMAVASAIATNTADVGIGDKFLLRQFNGLDFIPLGTLDMKLVFTQENASRPAFQAVIDIVQSEEFKHNLTALMGYDTSETGILRNL